MELLNVEIKAKCNDLDRIRQLLINFNAECKGIDHQIDTYFRVRNGRLKLREGNIEQYLIYYNRDNIAKPKQSNVLLHKTSTNSSLKTILMRTMGVLVVVDKMREIYFSDNVKFHLDKVKYLGTFVEIEAIDATGAIGREQLTRQCEHYLKELQIPDSDLVALSYSVMLLQGCKRF